MKNALRIGFAALLCVAACSSDDHDVQPQQLCQQVTVGEPQLRRLTAVELQHTIEDIFPELTGWQGVRLGLDPLSNNGFSNDASTLMVGNQTAGDWLQTAEDVAGLVTAAEMLPQLLPCAVSSADAACAEGFLQAYGQRLFRRPLTAAEHEAYLALHASVSAQSDFAIGIKWMLVALMQSPNAVYRHELGTPVNGEYQLSPFEIATALAYTYGGTTPSDTLLAKAAAGELSSPDALIDEARALLNTPRGRETFQLLLKQWLHYGLATGRQKTDIPDFPMVSALMEEETRLFLEQVLIDEGGGMRELLTDDRTLINDTLADFYGYGQAQDATFSSVTRPESWGIGILAQASLLAGLAHENSSSPTLRGLLVFERLLCNSVPPPPANIPPISTPQPGAITTRQRYEQLHVSNDGCASCHHLFDPSGFALEHFDAAGRYRADEAGLPLDVSGQVIFEAGAVDVEGLNELAQALAESEQPSVCASTLLAAYAYGGSAGSQCAIGAPQASLITEEIGLLEYFVRLAGTEHMFRRVTPEL